MRIKPIVQSGPVLGRFDRFRLIRPRAEGGPALRQLINTNLHFVSKLIVYSVARGLVFFKVFGDTKTVLKLFQRSLKTV